VKTDLTVELRQEIFDRRSRVCLHEIPAKNAQCHNSVEHGYSSSF